jgi:pimeloyl-ACP methyl ester carboxylesterase
VRGHLKAIEAFEACADLPSIAAPTLVITGAEDRLIVPENSRLMARRIPGAELRILPNCGHFFWVENPRETAQALGAFFARLG